MLTILIDNRDNFYLSTYGHSYTNESQTIWNGIVGKISLYAKENTYFKDILVVCQDQNKSIVVKGYIINNVSTNINISIDDTENNLNVAKDTLQVNDTYFEHTIYINKEIIPWNEFTPKLYELTLTTDYDTKKINFGFRHIKVIDRDILLNDKKIFLRGNLECCMHPQTGYPPFELEYWINLFQTVKDYGMNHIRFHSNCPPEICFVAGDIVGIYLQVEGPVWLDTWFMELGSHIEHYDFMPKEALRIINAYSNHPSFCIFCNGNEFRGDFSILHNIIEQAKSIRPDIIYTLTANYDRPLDILDDIFISVEADKKGMRGNRFYPKMATTFMTDYSEAVNSRNIPLIAHEGGQYCVYPNVNEIEKYTGNLLPMNYMAIKNDLEKRNLLHMTDKFVKASGDFSARLYKEEIESYSRTMRFGGFQLLGIQDFPGQCTATIGLLDSLWESKEIVSKEWFRQFCNDVVILIKSEKRIFTNTELFSCEVMINQFNITDINNANIIYNFIDENDNEIYSGIFNNITLKNGTQTIIGSIENIDLNIFKLPTKLRLNISIENTQYQNNWSIFVYPDIVEDFINIKLKESNIVLAYEWNNEILNMLDNGKKILLIPKRETFINRPTYDSSFYPVFWSPVFFNKKNPCGLYINEHPVFDIFTSDKYADYQWYNLLQNSFNFDVDILPIDFTPIVEAIPNYYYNHRLTNLIEANVSNGVLMICSIQLDDILDKVEARWFKYSIINYLSNTVEADYTLTKEQVTELFISEYEINEEKEQFVKENFIN